MSILKNRLSKLEQDRGTQFDLDKPLNEWSLSELRAYRKWLDPLAVSPDYSELTLEELRSLRDKIQKDKKILKYLTKT